MFCKGPKGSKLPDKIRNKGVKMITTKAEEGFTKIIHDTIGELSNDGRLSRQLRVVEWGSHPPKFDLRLWDVNSDRSSKGITLTKEELIKLKEILDSFDVDGYILPEKKIQPTIL